MRGKKDEFKDIKEQNERERQRLKMEEKQASQFKFGKMEKKEPFFPALKPRGDLGFEDEFRSIHVNEKYLDSTQKYQVMFPERSFEKKRKFNYTKHGSNYFTKQVCQESDTYDETLKKMMNSGERGVTVAFKKTKTKEGEIVTETQI